MKVQLRNRKNNLLKLIDKMQQYQFDQIDIDQPLEAHVRALTDEDSERWGEGGGGERKERVEEMGEGGWVGFGLR